MIRFRDFVRVEDCYFSVVGYRHDDGVRCLLRYVPCRDGDRIDSKGRRYRKLSHREALNYFKEFQRDGIFIIPHSMIDEIYRPDERLKDVCERDGDVRRVAEFFKLRRMGVTGSRLIGLKGKDSDIDFVAYGRYNFELGRKKIKKGIETGTLEKPNLKFVYRRRKVNLPFEVFKVHEERKLNKAVLNGVSFDLLYVRDYNEKPPIPEGKGKKIGHAIVTAEVKDDRFVFDYPACYFVDHPEIEAILSFTHTFVGQAFNGEVVEAYGVVEEIDGKYYLIVGTLRECNEYMVSKTLLDLSNLEYEFERWKAKTFKCSSKPSLKDLKLEVD